MWLMTRHGFYSIVQKNPGIYHVRAREKGDLERLTVPGGPLEGEPIRTGNSDYPYRVIVGRVEVKRLLAFLGDTLTYPNFKAAIGAISHQRHKRQPYSDIWHALLRALGGYGASPNVNEAPGSDWIDEPWCEYDVTQPGLTQRLFWYSSEEGGRE